MYSVRIPTRSEQRKTLVYWVVVLTIGVVMAAVGVLLGVQALRSASSLELARFLFAVAALPVLAGFLLIVFGGFSLLGGRPAPSWVTRRSR